MTLPAKRAIAYVRATGGRMTVLDQVRALIERLSPEPVCDDCVTEKLDLSVRQHANHKTRELAGAAGFERRKDVCAICGDTKIVIRRVRG
jgi:hypothetical protein